MFALQQALELYDFYDQQIQKCDQELEILYNEFDAPDQPDTQPPTRPKRKCRKNQSHFDLAQALFRMTGGIDLTEVTIWRL
jgi:transposase